jgi:hypothetical protein
MICNQCKRNVAFYEFNGESGICKTCIYINSRRELFRKNKSDKKNKVKKVQKTKKINDAIGISFQIYSRLKTRAKQKGISFDLTQDWIKQKLNEGACSVTGISLDFKNPRSPFSPSWDRLDSNLGYTKDNVRLVCWIYNCAKNEWNDDDVLAMAEAIIKNKKQA